MSKHSKIMKALKRGYKAWGARAIAIALTVTLSVEAVLGSGVSVALGQEIQQAYAYQQSIEAASGPTEQEKEEQGGVRPL